MFVYFFKLRDVAASGCFWLSAGQRWINVDSRAEKKDTNCLDDASAEGLYKFIVVCDYAAPVFIVSGLEC